MNEVDDILERLGPTFSEQAESLEKLPDERVADVLEGISAALRPAKPDDLESHRFVVNGALSGWWYPCTAPECRISNVGDTAEFAALYADSVYIRDPFEHLLLTRPDSYNALDRDNVVMGIVVYDLLRPLISAGFVRYAQSRVSLCEEHASAIGEPLKAQRHAEADKTREVVRAALEEVSTFEVGINSGGFYATISAPEEFVDHGGQAIYFMDGPPPGLKSMFPSKAGKKSIRFSDADELGLISRVVEPVLDDMVFQEWHSAFHDTRLLTNNSRFLNISTKARSISDYEKGVSITRALRHSVPRLRDVSVQSLIELREQEADAFRVYRNTLDAIARKAPECDEPTLARLFSEELAPEVDRLNHAISAWQAKERSEARKNLIIGSGFMALGLYTGMMPATFAGIVKACGAAHGFATADEPDVKARESDHYFLWKATGLPRHDQ